MGEQLELKVLKYNAEKNRVSLGLKQLNEEGWLEDISGFEIGSVVKGRVSSIVDYGAFVVLDSGIEGLVHINELSWTRKTKHPSQIVKEGEELEFKIIDIKKDSRKLGLSLKQTQANPWVDIEKKYQIGDVGEFEVVSVNDFGLFVKVDEEIDGLIRSSDVSWTENLNLLENYKVGDKVKAKVLELDAQAEKFSLSVKHLDEDPWSNIENKYPIGSRHTVQVTRFENFGAFVALEEGVEGLIHVSEISKKRVSHPQDVLKIGDKVEAEIVSIDNSAKKIGLKFSSCGGLQ